MGPRSPLLFMLALPWFVHMAVVVLSATGLAPLAGRAVPLAIVAAACAFSLALAHQGHDVPPDACERRLPAVVRAALSLLSFGGVTAWALGAACAVALPIVAYDALAYRLPVIAQWLDAGKIAWVTSDDPVRNGYPLGQEAVSAVVAAATGSMQLADVTSFPYLASGALSVWLLAETCGVQRAIARAAGGVFLLVPITILNAGSGYVDAAFAGATVALLCNVALLCSSARADATIAAAAGMAAAHVLALKGTGLGFVALVAVGALATQRFFRPRSNGRRVIAIALLFALPGAFWAVRDLIQTGNPLWPVEIRLAGHTLFAGTGAMSDILDVKHNTPKELATLSGVGRVVRTWLQWRGAAVVFDDRNAGLGWAWPLFALPAIVSFVGHLARDRDRRPGAAQLGFVLLMTATCFALQPMNWWSRYTIWLWGIGALALAFEAERLIALQRTRVLTGLCVVLTCLCLGEGMIALCHADGMAVAMRRWGQEREDLRALSDPRRAFNALYWVPNEFWDLGIDKQREICRGAWKPDTDDAILDGVFAQLTPRPQVHILADNDGDWLRMRRAWQATGCGELLLLRGSPVLARVARDPSVSLHQARAFDPFFVVRRSHLAARDREQWQTTL